MFRSNSSGSLNSDSDTLSIRFQYTEKFLEKCQSSFVKITEKEAGLRNCNDQFVEDIIEFTRHERINGTLRVQLEDFAKQLSIIQDYRDTLIKRIQHQVIEPLEKYHEIFKQKKEVLNKSRSKHRKDLDEREKFERKNNRYPSDHQGVATAENSLRYAKKESQHSQMILQDELTDFERMKLDDIKKYFGNFVLIELAFHSRALEYYTNAHRNLLKINEEKDLQDFREYYLSVPTTKSTPPPLTNSNSTKGKTTSMEQDEYANPPKKKDEKDDVESIGSYAEIIPKEQRSNLSDRLPPVSKKSQSISNLSRDSSSSSLYAQPAKPIRSNVDPKPKSNPTTLNLPSPSPSSSSSSTTSSDSDD